jgi:hypothetical protein
VWRLVIQKEAMRLLREMEKQGMSEKEVLEKLYDAGFTNALMQLRGLIGQFIEKPNSQTTKVYELITVMLEVKEGKDL